MCFPPEDVINQTETDNEGTLLSAGRLTTPAMRQEGCKTEGGTGQMWRETDTH